MTRKSALRRCLLFFFLCFSRVYQLMLAILFGCNFTTMIVASVRAKVGINAIFPLSKKIIANALISEFKLPPYKLLPTPSNP
jgi:hypothetical protein